MNSIELLSPVGSYEAFVAAINNGADSVYLGGRNFGARATTESNANFSNEEIKDMIKKAHLAGVKVYVTVNTLIKDDEFNDCLNFVNFLYINHVDAILIQDMGLAYVLRQIFPDLTLHASTQMNVMSVEDAKRLKMMGFKRIVLARECSIELIKEIKKEVDIEIEVFCHGALCMSYSGNCYMSSLIGRRSGNRGRCAGACRLQYELIKSKSDEAVIDNNMNDFTTPAFDKAYYLSLKDLYTLDKVEELKRAKVDCIKIEGRLKRAEYVGLITKAYKDAIKGNINITDTTYKMQEMFNREFTKGYIFNDLNSNMTNIKSPNHVGVSLGSVIKVYKEMVVIKLDELSKNDTLNLGDSVRITNGEIEDGITISRMDKLILDSANNYKTVGRISSAHRGEIIGLYPHIKLVNGMTVLKTSTKSLMDQYSDNTIINKKLDIKAKLFIENNKLGLTYYYNDLSVSGLTTLDVSKAINNMDDRIIEQVKKLGDTSFNLIDVENDAKGIFIPIKEINELRRKLIAELEDKILNNYPAYNKQKFIRKNIEYNSERNIVCKVRTKDQLDVCLNLGIKNIITENKELVSDNVIYMNPRTSMNHGITLDNKYSSVYLNVFNAYSLYYYHQLGINTVGLSIELSKDEIESLIYNYNKLFNTKPNVMMMVYGFYESMIMKHCLINKAFNHDKKYCLECEKTQYYLKDKKDFCFALVRGEDCNLKLLNSMRLNLIKYLDNIYNMGVNTILLDFTIENKNETFDVLQNYINAFNGDDYNSSLDLSTYGHFKDGIE